ncbi:MAG: methylated-DNA--[protein]-cysteine S-methyltransferase [Alphaproteobacteria bacterium]|nr:methylated-DNA--[protein]-cysteine S-methyltransferase [Alphaproteobacteria bacterium]
MKLRMKTAAPKRVMWGLAASPAGKLVVGITSRGEVCRVSFLRGRKAKEIVAEWKKAWPQTEFCGGAAVADFAERPVLLIGTTFQHAVWRAMSKIPAGRTMAYGELARRIGKAGAARAVGAACGANPVPVLVPCHRVVAANGGLGGYSGGIRVKKALLGAEKATFL